MAKNILSLTFNISMPPGRPEVVARLLQDIYRTLAKRTEEMIDEGATADRPTANGSKRL